MRETLHKSLLRVTAEQTPVILSRAQALFSSALIWSECENITHRFPCRHLGKVNEVAGAVWLTCSVCKVECENAVAHARLANYVHLSRELEWQPKRTGLNLRHVLNPDRSLSGILIRPNSPGPNVWVRLS